MQHAPGRKVLGDFPMVAMPTVTSEIALIEAFADTTVIGVTVNHENLSTEQLATAIDEIELRTGLPATDRSHATGRARRYGAAGVPDAQPATDQP